MERATAGRFSDLPHEMLSFALKPIESASFRPRLGQLLAKGRNAIETPHYVATTSRGIVPHISPDTMQKSTGIAAVYIPLEDFLEKSRQDAPIFKTPVSTHQTILRKYTALPEKCLSILGPRRIPPLPCPAQSTHSSISISTSVGFASLQAEDYNNAVRRLQSDVSVALADVVDSEKSSVKRIAKSADRTHAWLRDSLAGDVEEGETTTISAVFASIPPIEKEQQSFYLSDLGEEFASQLSGLCLYSPPFVCAIPSTLQHLPRICLSDPSDPHAVLSAISNGIDLITTPFVTTTSEHGIALCFLFPPSTKDGDPNPLGIDIWSPSHATSLIPLAEACSCYTCTRHHRAYVHHLLQAKEMLAWTLLQIHNFAVLDEFFHAVRISIANGTFEQDAAAFGQAYEPDMPKQTGQGPRVRGYQMKSMGGGEPRKNPKAYGRLDDQLERQVEAEDEVSRPDSEADAEALVQAGFAEKAP